ncbi:hypothetical protein RHMOL_Rhmol05G0281000 [Rhododendron molle]|uniref:Uncharacterized protein n=1 Tax=Rhododendron molle TaxID=49168 RepID=A0ACC0NVZ0_RHOML|nr:hypothetical protein RHMOL_Rhmol05G0281000 [Rhododendron molle]
MAENLDDGEFWLPPQFLTDDDILMDFTKTHNNSNVNRKNREADSGLLFPYEYPSGFGPYYHSDLSSPVESVVSSTETESDEDEYLAGLTRKLARSTILDDLLKADSALGYENQKPWAMAGSPQSTLSSFMGGYQREGSSRGSPNGPSLGTSPPQAAPLNRSDTAWSLLYAAAGEVARMRMSNPTTNEGFVGGYYQKEGLFCPPRIPSPVLKQTHQGFQPSNKQSLSYQQLQVAQFQQLKQQQMMKQQQQGTTIWGQPDVAHQVVQNRGRTSAGAGRTLGLSPAAWPTLQQSQQQQPQAGSGMRALFLGNGNGAKRECAGTGVFLPRRVGSPTETRKKPACATVLLPDRVVQALNLNLEAMDAQSQPHLHQAQFNRTSTADYDAAALKYRHNVLLAQQRRGVRAQAAGMNHEQLRLPSEWSY